MLTGLALQVTGGMLLIVLAAAGGGLPAILAGYLLVVAPLGLVLPNSTALALADHAAHAGSASAILGAASYLVGAAVAPLTGLGGTASALPSMVVIAASAAVGLLILVGLTSASARASTVP